MLIYFILLGLVILVLWLGKVEEKVNFSTIPVITATLLLTAFAALRKSSVGTDTNNYVGMFYSYQRVTEAGYEMKGSIEKGYVFLMYLASLLSKEYWAILFIISLFCVFFYMYVISKVSEDIVLSVFIYIVLGTYVIFFNAARQGLAVSISAVSMIFLLKKSLWKYMLVIVIASFFHRTALIMLPFYFILRLPFSYKNAGLFLGLGLVSFYFLSRILSIFDSDVEMRYGEYENRGARGGELLSLYFVVSSVFLVYARKFIPLKKIRTYDVFLNYTMFTAIIYLVVLITSSDVNFIRLTNYFAIGYIMIYPLLLRYLDILTGGIAKMIFVIINLVFFAIYLSKMANLTPYLFNPNLI